MHRDLKPEHILMKRKKDVASVKITDFGFCKQKGRAESFLGTMGYLAPEITEGLPYTKVRLKTSLKHVLKTEDYLYHVIEI